jgi:hypothetical protein
MVTSVINGPYCTPTRGLQTLIHEYVVIVNAGFLILATLAIGGTVCFMDRSPCSKTVTP